MDNDTLQMQREAARRVQRMQEHSRRVFEQHRQEPTASQPAYQPVQPVRTAGDRQAIVSPGLYSRPAPTVQTASPSAPSPVETAVPAQDGLLASLNRMETDQWLLLGLALLLFRGGCRPELTLALLYLAM